GPLLLALPAPKSTARIHHQKWTPGSATIYRHRLPPPDLRGFRPPLTRVPRLAEELRILHGAGSFRRWLQQLAKIDVLVLDDWGIGNLDAATRADLLEIIDDRVGQRATIIAHQLPIEHWHAWLGDPTVADAILDRLLQSCRRFSLDGESRRTGRTARSATVSKNEHQGAQ
ncbi:ATP-binding protein, partial [Hydrogenophaga sp.]|uniref:ATP-binding protein n=1 Tax=Hydrogenophaga sp. TaxID=1904254 RepID=UPI00273184D9